MVSWAITGASRGLGLEFIRQLSQDSNNVVFAIVRDPKSSSELSQIAAAKSNVHIVKGDLNSLEQLQDAAKTVSSVTGGSLDILINNGAYLDAVTPAIPITQLTTPENLDAVKTAFEKSVESNVVGAIYLTNTFLPLIEQGKEKKIIHTTTGLAERDFIQTTELTATVPYGSSKAMLNHIVAIYGAELQPKGIHVVAISPGWVDTNPMPQEALDYMASQFRKADPSVQGRISKETSVHDQLETIKKLGWDVQGRAISHHGDRNWF